MIEVNKAAAKPQQKNKTAIWRGTEKELGTGGLGIKDPYREAKGEAQRLRSRMEQQDFVWVGKKIHATKKPS